MEELKTYEEVYQAVKRGDTVEYQGMSGAWYTTTYNALYYEKQRGRSLAVTKYRIVKRAKPKLYRIC